jgi:hypothetical protein
MKKNQSSILGRWGIYLCALAALYGVAVLIYLFVETGKPLGSRDFHQFWYAGHFVIQGRDPYSAYFAGEQPRLPIHYLDRVVVNQYPVAQGDLTIIPSNTPLILLLLTPFSFFSWVTAKWLFLIINLILMLLTGWLVLRRIPFAGVRLSLADEVFIFLVYLDLSATRIAIENGQTTLTVFFLMLLAILYAKRSWKISGSALGIALSKYSLSLPIFLFFIYKKNFRILFLAMAVQVFGLLGLSAITRSSPVAMARENIRLLVELFDQPGIHLARFFEIFTKNHILIEIPVLLMTLLVFVLLLIWLRAHAYKRSISEDVLDFHVLTILFIWTMLVAYHRLYDTLILIFFVVLFFKGIAVPGIWKLTPRQQTVFSAVMAILPFILIVPARLVDKVIPGYYGTKSDAVTTLSLLILLIISMLLLRRFLQNTETQNIGRRTDVHDIRTDSHRDTQPRWVNYSQSSSSIKRSK